MTVFSFTNNQFGSHVKFQCPRCKNIETQAQNDAHHSLIVSVPDFYADEYLLTLRCHACKKLCIWLGIHDKIPHPAGGGSTQLIIQPDKIRGAWIYPKFITAPVPDKVDEEIAKEVNLAEKCLSVSVEASVAHLCRCLEKTLWKIGIKSSLPKPTLGNLIDSIDKELSEELIEDLRIINKKIRIPAIHFKLDAEGTTILPEKEDVEFMLSTLRSIFEEKFVRPAKQATQRKVLKQRIV